PCPSPLSLHDALPIFAGAHMADRLGRRLNFVIFSVLSGVCVYFYTQVPLTDSQMLFLGFPLGFAASGIFGGLGAYLTELFPTEIDRKSTRLNSSHVKI